MTPLSLSWHERLGQIVFWLRRLALLGGLCYALTVCELWPFENNELVNYLALQCIKLYFFLHFAPGLCAELAPAFRKIGEWISWFFTGIGDVLSAVAELIGPHDAPVKEPTEPRASPAISRRVLGYVSLALGAMALVYVAGLNSASAMRFVQKKWAAWSEFVVYLLINKKTDASETPLSQGSEIKFRIEESHKEVAIAGIDLRLQVATINAYLQYPPSSERKPARKLKVIVRPLMYPPPINDRTEPETEGDVAYDVRGYAPIFILPCMLANIFPAGPTMPECSASLNR